MTSSLLQLALRANERIKEDALPPVCGIDPDNMPTVLEGILFQHKGQLYHAFKGEYSVWVVNSGCGTARPYWRPIHPRRNYRLMEELQAAFKKVTDNGPENA